MAAAAAEASKVRLQVAEGLRGAEEAVGGGGGFTGGNSIPTVAEYPLGPSDCYRIGIHSVEMMSWPGAACFCRLRICHCGYGLVKSNRLKKFAVTNGPANPLHSLRIPFKHKIPAASSESIHFKGRFRPRTALSSGVGLKKGLFRRNRNV